MKHVVWRRHDTTVTSLWIYYVIFDNLSNVQSIRCVEEMGVKEVTANGWDIKVKICQNDLNILQRHIDIFYVLILLFNLTFTYL